MHATTKLFRKSAIALAVALLVSLPTSPAQAQAGTVAQTPLFLTQAVEPMVMLNLSNDHQLYFKAYDDYSDLTGDGIPDTTYNHDFDYYGYFDSYKCYTYQTAWGRYDPTSDTADKYCSGTWSGNFLNWASMTRIDVVRKVLYGGKRSIDTIYGTVLERSYLPGDAHSFAKFYDGSDLNQLTPFTSASGATFCNTTYHNGSTYSEDVTSPPLLRVAAGDHSLWAGNERWQCRWSEERGAANGNTSAVTGLNASSSNPSRSSTGLGEDDYIVRVRVCNAAVLGTEKCKFYPSGDAPKPVGLLQDYGDEGLIDFGLMMGSYARNKSGGMLRKNIGSITDEINVDTTGILKTTPADGGIIGTLDLLRVHGYSHDDGVYNTGDDCSWGLNSFSDGDCSNWGNPSAEMFLESLRYYAGLVPTAAFQGDDDAYIDGLDEATWADPIPENKWCAPLNVIQFNASAISYDGNALGGAANIGISDLDGWTDEIADGEGITGNRYFVGENGVDNNQLCTAKTVGSLGDVEGICPDVPRLEGTYQIAGLAYYANTNDLRDDRQFDQRVSTTSVSLAPARPGVTVPVPANPTQSVTILPACRNSDVGGNCALVEFKIVEQDLAAGTGKLYINWEDSEQGGDFDQDMWGMLDYEINAGGTEIDVTTDAIFESTIYDMGFGYIISGTTQDGFHAHSGIEGFDYNDPTGAAGCDDCQTSDGPTTNTYTIGTAAADQLEQPLWYAAKWGGFRDDDLDGNPNLDLEWDSDGNGVPDQYHEATNPAELESALDNAFLGAIRTRASAASVATNSTRLDVDTVVYQARFDSEDWRGELLAFSIESDGAVGDLKWDAGNLVPNHLLRDIYTLRPGGTPVGAEFTWANLTAAQQTALDTNIFDVDDGLGEERLAWIRGDQTDELQNGGAFRSRPVTVLGDIVNSDPFFVGTPDFRYDLLPDATEAAAYTAFRATTDYLTRRKMLYVGANDGMLHALDADTGVEQFAFIPNSSYENMSELTALDYAHRYFVDGSPRVGDAYLNSAWKSVLVGSTGAGGRAVFALDVTDPDYFDGGDVMWEFTHAELGTALSQPTIVRLADGGWYAIFGNGHSSDSESAQLFIVDLSDGSLEKLIDTGVGDGTDPNGLMTPIPIDLDGDRVTDTIYAADLVGNIWKFDVDNANPNQWGVAFTQGPNNHPLFTATDADGNPQPITSRPQVGSHEDGGVMVYFGTGKYFEVGDNVVPADPQIQTFYGVRDEGSRIENGRDDLQGQTIIAEVEAFGSDIRAVSDNEVDWTTDQGWFLDLESPVNGPEGERVVANPLLRFGRVIFTTLIPSSEPCDFGGTGWLMELDALSGKRLDYSVFDLSEDTLFNADDFVEIEVDGETIRVPVSGEKSEVGIIKTPGIITAGDREYKYSSGSTGEIGVTVERGSTLSGRQSWRQLR